ncbi:MAG: SRPBCC domain-containing protein [Methanobacterium sp.]|nr:SRPBCC domain-containing protein [Methanobacterium sp.]
MDGKELTITRVFNAKRDLVWKAFTNPEIFRQWWGPKEFITPVVKIDLKVGGEHFNCMQAPDGETFCSKGVYKEIDPPRKLVVTDSFADEEGNIVPATYHELGEGFPMEMLLKISFEEQDNKTKITIKHSDVSNINESELNDMRQGWIESLDKLDECLSKCKI